MMRAESVVASAKSALGRQSSNHQQAILAILKLKEFADGGMFFHTGLSLPVEGRSLRLHHFTADDSGRRFNPAENGPLRARRRADQASTGDDTLHEEHREAAERHELAAKAHRIAAGQHELAAQAYRTAAEHNEKGDGVAGSWHAERAKEFSERAYELAEEAHAKSGQIVSL